MIRLDLSNTVSFRSHRSGWGYCMSKLKPFHSKNGILVDDFIEKTFCWDLLEKYYNQEAGLPYKKPWIGFLHNPPNVPDWYDVYNSPQCLINGEMFKESLPHCRALVVLSDYLKQWLEKRVDVPVISVKHPTEIASRMWKPQEFFRSKTKTLLQIGYWLRNVESFINFKQPPSFKREWLPSNYDYALKILSVQEKRCPDFYKNRCNWAGVRLHKFISNEEFDYKICKSVVFLDLFDSSANNAIVESIARNVPLLVNRIPATEEYLGKDYPMFFTDLKHAEQLISDDDLIYSTHLYLKNMNKEWISGP